MISLSSFLPEKKVTGFPTATGREKDDTEKMAKNGALGKVFVDLAKKINDPDFDGGKVLDFIKQNTITFNDKGKPSTSKGRYNLVAPLYEVFKEINKSKEALAPIAISEGILKYMIFNDFEENKDKNILILDKNGKFKSKLGTNDLGGAPHVYEHMVPSNYIVSAFFKGVSDGKINNSNIQSYLQWAIDHLTALAIITKEEDNSINSTGLRDNLPGGFNKFYDSFISKDPKTINDEINKRYKSIKLIINKGEKPLNDMEYEILEDQNKITYDVNGTKGFFEYKKGDEDFDLLQMKGSIIHHNKFRKDGKIDLDALKDLYNRKKLTKSKAEKILQITNPDEHWKPGEYEEFKTFISEVSRMQELAGIKEINWDEFDESDFEGMLDDLQSLGFEDPKVYATIARTIDVGFDLAQPLENDREYWAFNIINEVIAEISATELFKLYEDYTGEEVPERYYGDENSKKLLKDIVEFMNESGGDGSDLVENTIDFVAQENPSALSIHNTETNTWDLEDHLDHLEDDGASEEDLAKAKEVWDWIQKWSPLNNKPLPERAWIDGHRSEYFATLDDESLNEGYEEFNPDDFEDFDSFDKDMQSLGFEHIRPETVIKLTMTQVFYLVDDFGDGEVATDLSVELTVDELNKLLKKFKEPQYKNFKVDSKIEDIQDHLEFELDEYEHIIDIFDTLAKTRNVKHTEYDLFNDYGLNMDFNFYTPKELEDKARDVYVENVKVELVKY